MLVDFGLVDLFKYFRKHLRFCYLKKWSRVQQGILLRSRYDYILGTDRSRFKMVVIRGARNYSSDYFALRDRLLQIPVWCHGIYLRVRRSFPLFISEPEYFILTDKKLQ